MVLVKCGGHGHGINEDGDQRFNSDDDIHAETRKRKGVWSPGPFGVCRQRRRRIRLFGRPHREACVAGEEAFIIVEGHYSVCAEMWHAGGCIKSKGCDGGHGNDDGGAASILSVPGQRVVL
jgi:hypothetical protein